MHLCVTVCGSALRLPCAAVHGRARCDVLLCAAVYGAVKAVCSGARRWRVPVVSAVCGGVLRCAVVCGGYGRSATMCGSVRYVCSDERRCAICAEMRGDVLWCAVG